MPFTPTRIRALASPLALVLTVAFTATAGAQAVLGYGEDATAAPAGAIRVRLSNDWHRSRTINFGNDTTYDSDRQFRASTIGLELGIQRRITIGVTAPWVATKAITFVSSAFKNGQALDTLLDKSHNGWGNIEAFGKIVWLGEPGQEGRLAFRSGVHVRSALLGGALLGTGTEINPTDPFGLPTSDRAKALLASSETDIVVGPHFFGSLVGRYEKPFSDNALVAVHPGTNPYAADAVTFVAQRKLGASYEFEFTPRYQLLKYFALGVQYRYHHGAQAQYTGQASGEVNGAPVTLDASTLDAGTELTVHRVGFGVVYSAVDAYTRNRSRWPIEVTFEHSNVVSITGGQPKESETLFSVRVFRRLWGAEFAPPARAPKPPKEVPPAPTPSDSTPLAP